MANNLKIRVDREGGISPNNAVDEGGTITLQNDFGQMVKFNFGTASPLCSGPAPQLTVDLNPGQSASFQACMVPQDLGFPYNAALGTAPDAKVVSKSIVVKDLAPVTYSGAYTNPVIVIHREIQPFDYFLLAAGIFIGVVLSMFIENRWMKKRPGL